MKGIILAGGSGSRLAPITSYINKHFLPIYDKPMIHYPLSTLMLVGIKEILIICGSEKDKSMYKEGLKNGEHLGINIDYMIQPHPKGIADALIIGEDFIKGDSVALILGDNIFYMGGLGDQLAKFSEITNGGAVLLYHVQDPQRYGVAEFNKKKELISIIEKPKKPKSNWAVTGLYFYDNKAVEIAKSLTPSSRGELEITDVNEHYLKESNLSYLTLGRGTAWFDAGTFDSMLDASFFVQIIETRQGLKVGCLEEISYSKGFINTKQYLKLAKSFKTNNPYRRYLEKLVEISF